MCPWYAVKALPQLGDRVYIPLSYQSRGHWKLIGDDVVDCVMQVSDIRMSLSLLLEGSSVRLEDNPPKLSVLT